MQYPGWMPPVGDDAVGKHGAKKTSNDAPGSAEEMLSRVLSDATARALRPDWVQRAPNLWAKGRRWLLRGIWRLIRKLLRKAGARRVVFAPFYLCAATYLISAIMHLFDHGALTILAGFGTGAPVVYWWVGGPAWVLTRRRELRPLPQRIWIAAGYAMIALLGVLTAAWRVGVPMPGMWLTTAVALSTAVAWFRRRRVDEVEVDDTDARHRLWDQEKKVKGTSLGPILDLNSPRRWVAEVDLSGTDMLVEDLAKKAPHIAKRFRAGRGNVIVDEAVPGVDVVARLTVVLENRLFKPVEFDPSWLEITDQGCVQFHGYPDGGRGQLRLFKPMSGTVNALFSGDIDGGKSGGMFAAMIGALMTGRCYPIVGDPQGGQSLPDLCGEAGIAPMKARDAEGVYNLLLKVHAGMLARSAFLQTYRWIDKFGDLRVGMGFFDQDVMAAQKPNPELGVFPLFWPIIVFVIDEAHKACQDPEWGEAIVKLLEQIIKLSRKTGIAVWLATQYPGIEELGNKMVIRQNLVTGNVICYRNSSKTTGTMILNGDMPEPHTIPKLTPDGKPTQGMCVISSAAPASSRNTIARSVFIERQGYWAKLAAERIHPLDEITAKAMEAVDLDALEARLSTEVEAYLADKARAEKAGAAVPAQAGPADGTPAWHRGTVLERCIAYLRHLEVTTGYGETTTGLLAAETNSELNAVSTALGRAANPKKRGAVALVHSPRRGTWCIGPKPAEELVGASA